MSGKLDKSLDEILVNRRQGARGRGSARRGKPAATAAASGGIRKAKATKATAKGSAQASTGPVPTTSKIMVSGLPADVNEANIKEYFTKSAGPVKRAMLNYNQNGRSLGVANIIFSKPETAAKAAKDLNGLLVDGRPMKIEVIVDASHAPGVPEPKPLTERIAQSKSQPKPATGGKAAGTGRRGRRTTARRGGRASNRPKPKTAEELDAEMEDYYTTNENGAPAEGGNAAVNNGPAPAQQAATNGGEDVGMAEIS